MTKHPLFAALILVAAAGPVDAGSFTYRGQLNEDGVAANGRYDLQLQLYADPSGTRPLAAPIDLADVAVKDGQFAVAVELPELLADTAWLEVSVRPEGEYAYWPLGAKEAVALKGAVCPAAWALNGNAGTVPGTNFLGTTDSQPFEIRTANVRGLRIEPSAELFEGAPITTNMIGGSRANTVVAGVRGATIAGGGVPAADADPAFGGGGPNLVAGHYATIAGGFGNRVGSAASFPPNVAFATVGGGTGNQANNRAATVAGGAVNLATGNSATVAGGSNNQANGTNSVVAGGSVNLAEGDGTHIGGGALNQALGVGSVVAGGRSNIAGATSASYNTVSGGEDNAATGSGATVGGGELNVAAGNFSSIPGGSLNCAGGLNSFAGGFRAKALPAFNPGDGGACSGLSGYSAAAHDGTFVWADSQAADFISSGPDQFVLRARGGAAINGTPISNAVELSVVADADGSDFSNLFLRQRSNNAGILFSAGGASSTGANDASFFIDHFNGAGGQARRLALNGDGSVVIRSNIVAVSSGVTMAAGAGAWSALSDRNVKTAISAVDPGAILDRLVSIPISEWSYIAQGEGIRHLGPMAQDFAAAFGLGENDTTISSIDADGVALAAIQGLNSKLERENAALRTRVDSLSAEMASLRSAVEALRAHQEH